MLRPFMGLSFKVLRKGDPETAMDCILLVERNPIAPLRK
jgi:hypothetical protein